MENKRKIRRIFFVAVMVCFVLLGDRCQEYRMQISKLQDGIAGCDKEIVECKKEQKSLRTLVYGYTTETGFSKKGIFYLIDTVSQLEQLALMIQEGEEIEPGVAAAEASYRLRNDLQVKDWFSIGTKEMPFCGSFDGDGHRIYGNLPGQDREVNDLFRTGGAATIENLKVGSYMHPDSGVYIELHEGWECRELAKNLTMFPECKVQLSVEAWNLDTQEIADAMKEHWERNKENENYYVSVFFDPEYIQGENLQEPDTENTMTPFCMVAGEEWGKIVKEAVEEEEGYLRFLRLERIGGLKCCTFEIGKIENGYRVIGEEGGYHIILEGEWEGKEAAMQHLFIPYARGNYNYTLGEWSGWYNGKLTVGKGNSCIEDVDVNFDGKLDLLIHEGSSGGTGGHGHCYRAVVWKEDEKQFAYYPSFPSWVVSLEFEKQRIVVSSRMGASQQEVKIYRVVNGEYVCSERLVWEDKYNAEEERNISTLYYYQMGELVETHVLTSEWYDQWDEVGELYPDLSYWAKG